MAKPQSYDDFMKSEPEQGASNAEYEAWLEWFNLLLEDESFFSEAPLELNFLPEVLKC